MPQSPIYHKPWDFPWRDKKISPNKRIWDRSLSLSLKFSPSVYKITFFALREAVADMGFAGWTFPSVSVPLNPLWILLRLPLSLSLCFFVYLSSLWQLNDNHYHWIGYQRCDALCFSLFKTTTTTHLFLFTLQYNGKLLRGWGVANLTSCDTEW